MHAGVGTVAVIAVLLAGCTDITDDDGTPTPGPTTTSGPTEPTREPSTEGTGPETAQTEQRQPSISIANAPIGGDVDTVDADGLLQCAEVNWLGRNPIPDGTRISLGRASLVPKGVFEFYQPACGGDFRPCTDVQWASNSFRPCYAGVRQIANGTEDVDLVIPVRATCTTQDDCDSLAAGKGPTQISFTPQTIEPPTEPPDTPTEPSTEPPVETPSESVSGDG